eukprot:403344551
MNTYDIASPQIILFDNCNFSSNFGIQNGLFYVEENALLQVKNSLVKDNYSIGRGSFIFSQRKNSKVFLSNLTITNNYAEQGGVIFLQNYGFVEVENCTFLSNFAITGGVLYLQNDAQAVMSYQQHINKFGNHELFTMDAIKGTVIINNQTRIEWQVQLLKMQTLSLVKIQNVSISETQIVNSQLIRLAQSHLIVLNTNLTSLSSTSYEFIEVRSDSQFDMIQSTFENITGCLINTKNSIMMLNKMKLKNITNNIEGKSVIQSQRTDITIENLQLSTIKSNFMQPILDFQASTLKIRYFEASDFNSRLFNLFETSLLLNNSFIKSANNHHKKGIVFQISKSQIEIVNATISNISGLQGSVFFVTDKIQTQLFKSNVKIANSVFENNNALISGGVIFLENADIIVQNSTFNGNQALNSGGSIFLSCSNKIESGCQQIVKNNTFTNNYAAIKGGAVNYENERPQGLSTNLAQNNFAYYGNDWSSYPVSMALINLDNQDFQNLPSGQVLDLKVQAGLYDQDHQLYLIDDKSIGFITTTDIQLSLSGRIKSSAIRGVFSFDEIKIKAYPNYKSKIMFESDVVIEELSNQISLSAHNVQTELIVQEGIGGYESLCEVGSVLKNPRRNKPWTVLVRILTGYVQIVMICKDFELEWPDNVRAILDYLSIFISSQETVLSFDCILLNMGFDRQDVFLAKNIIYGLLPIILSLLAALIWIIIRFTVKRQVKDFELKIKINLSVSALIMFLFPTVTTINFTIFQCYSFEDGNSYVQKYMDLRCQSPYHQKLMMFVGVPFIVLWCLVFPLLVFRQLRNIRKDLDNPKNLKSYGIFYIGLQDNAYFWENIVVNFKKIFFIICSTFIPRTHQTVKVRLVR